MSENMSKPPRPEPGVPFHMGVGWSSWDDTARVTFLIMATVAAIIIGGLLLS